MHDYALLPGNYPHQQGKLNYTSHLSSRLVTAHFVAVTVSASLSEEADNDAATQEGNDEVNPVDEDPDSSVVPEFILPAVDKESGSESFCGFQPWLTVL